MRDKEQLIYAGTAARQSHASGTHLQVAEGYRDAMSWLAFQWRASVQDLFVKCWSSIPPSFLHEASMIRSFNAASRLPSEMVAQCLATEVRVDGRADTAWLDPLHQGLASLILPIGSTRGGRGGGLRSGGGGKAAALGDQLVVASPPASDRFVLTGVKASARAGTREVTPPPMCNLPAILGGPTPFFQPFHRRPRPRRIGNAAARPSESHGRQLSARTERLQGRGGMGSGRRCSR